MSDKPSTGATAVYVVSLLVGGWVTLAVVSISLLAMQDQQTGSIVLVSTLAALTLLVGLIGLVLAAISFFRTKRPNHVGLWLFLLTLCLAFHASGTALHGLPVNIGITLNLGSIGLGVNFAGLPLLLVAAAFILD